MLPCSSSRQWGKASGAAPLTCPRPELKKLLDGLGLQDPQGFLFKEMMTWVQGPDTNSKAALRKRCCQKLEEMIHWLQVLVGRCGAGHLRGSLLSLPQPPGFPQVPEGVGRGIQVRRAALALLCAGPSLVHFCPPTLHLWASSCPSPGRSLLPGLKAGGHWCLLMEGSLCLGLGGRCRLAASPHRWSPCSLL